MPSASASTAAVVGIWAILGVRRGSNVRRSANFARCGERPRGRANARARKKLPFPIFGSGAVEPVIVMPFWTAWFKDKASLTVKAFVQLVTGHGRSRL